MAERIFIIPEYFSWGQRTNWDEMIESGDKIHHVIQDPDNNIKPGDRLFFRFSEVPTTPSPVLSEKVCKRVDRFCIKYKYQTYKRSGIEVWDNDGVYVDGSLVEVDGDVDDNNPLVIFAREHGMPATPLIESDGGRVYDENFTTILNFYRLYPQCCVGKLITWE